VSWLMEKRAILTGDPVSPLLFNLVGGCLNKNVNKGIQRGLIKGLMENFRPGGLLALQYTDNTLFFSSCDRIAPRNLKIVLMLFDFFWDGDKFQ
jgi:hypothetical protein